MQIRRLWPVPAMLALVVLVVGIAAATDPISIVASNWKFTPSTITLKVGVPQVLRVSSAEGVHGLQSDALGISQMVIAPGKATDITVTPKKAGTFVVHCSIECGAGHANMALTVTVEP
jgi:cytochrome c oxidase subunit II